MRVAWLLRALACLLLPIRLSRADANVVVGADAAAAAPSPRRDLLAPLEDSPASLVATDAVDTTAAEERLEVRYAVLITGHLRSANDTIENLERLVRPYNAPVVVDAFYHVWANLSDGCHNETIRRLQAAATDLSFEPVQCSWRWGTTMYNQWHAVDHAARRLIDYERAHRVRYRYIIKIRTDIVFTAPFDFGGQLLPSC